MYYVWDTFLPIYDICMDKITHLMTSLSELFVHGNGVVVVVCVYGRVCGSGTGSGRVIFKHLP